MLYNLNSVEDYDRLISEHTNGAFSTFDMEVLVPEVKKVRKGGTYVEIGVDKGKSLGVALFAARKGVNVVGIDIIDTPERQELFLKLGLTRYASFIHGFSDHVAKFWKKKIDVLFIDGNHSYSGCCLDIESWLPHMKKGGRILFHDCDSTSPGVVAAVDKYFYGHIELFATPEKRTSMARVQL